MLQLNAAALRLIWPRAPQTIVDVFVRKHKLMDEAGISLTRQRLSIFLSQLEHEAGGWTIPNLTENINYSADRAVQIWPSRFSSSAGVYSAIGSFAGDPRFRFKLMDSVYGNRMGNRPGTNDGSRYIGRGGAQITGRDGYRAIGELIGVDLETNPERATEHELQPEICTAFWRWKKLNPYADSDGLRGVTRIWNGGLIGMADREAQFAGNNPIIARLETHDRASAVLESGTRALQAALNRLGADPQLDEDGINGDKTRAAVRAFQRKHGLKVDGVAGERETWPAIRRELAKL